MRFFGPFQLMLTSFVLGTVSTVVLLGGRVGEGCDVFFNPRPTPKLESPLCQIELICPNMLRCTAPFLEHRRGDSAAATAAVR